MNHELAKTLTTALVQFIDEQRPEGTMCCSSAECERIESSFKLGDFPSIEQFIKKKLSRLTEFEKRVRFIIDEVSAGRYSADNIDDVRGISEGLLELAKNELAKRDEVITLGNLPPFDKGFQDGKAEAMADLERTFECNPDKLPGWLKDELAKRHLEGYIKGREETMREMKDFLESHFDTKKAREGEDLIDLYRKEYAQPLCLRKGGVCTNPMRDCINCIPTLERFNTSSGTSTATLHGNTSATDGKEHNPSFID